MNTVNEAAYTGDIVNRLRNWRGLHLAHGGELFEEAADEITSLREAIRGLADQDATLSVVGGNVIVEMDVALTDAEREAVDMAIDLLNGVEDVSAGASRRADAAAATLRGLLERLGKAGP